VDRRGPFVSPFPSVIGEVGLPFGMAGPAYWTWSMSSSFSAPA